MKFTIKVPKLGLTTESVLLSEWTQPVGARVAKGQVIALVEADKASVDVEAPVAGLVIQHLAAPGAELNVGDPLVVIET